MKNPDRFRSLLDRALGGRNPLEDARYAFEREFPRLAKGLVDSAFADVEGFKDQARVAPYLVALGGILYEDYDGTELRVAEWSSIRDLISDFAGDLDMSIVSYAMSLVLENGALE